MIELTKAVLATMKEVKGINKGKTVGEGKFAYDGVADEDVKRVIREVMAKNGLILLPIEIESTITVNRWEEVYQDTKKAKQTVFTEAKTKYLLLHESGESQVLAGYGHGVDSQDKSAGKATTYALKYLLLYLFLVPTGKIDDADNTHSEKIDAPPVAAKVQQPEDEQMIFLTEDQFNAAMKGTKKQIIATLKAYNGTAGKKMLPDYTKKLSEQLNIAPTT